MEVQVNETEYCKLEAVYEADPDVVEAKRDEVIADLRSTKIPGFRKGKASDSAIKARLGKRIDKYLTEQMKAQAFDDVIFDTEAKAIGNPKFDDVKIKGNDFSCKLTFMKRPDFSVEKYVFDDIPKPESSSDVESELQQSLEDLRLRFGDVEPYGDDDFVTKGDQVSISFDALIDGESFEGSSTEGQLYVVGQPGAEDFDDNILGMTPGEEREFKLTFPEQYPAIGGKTADFKLSLQMGTKKKPAALDEDFAKQLGEKTISDLTDKLRKIATAKVDQEVKLKVRQQIIDRLVSENEFKVPDYLLDIESQTIAIQSGIDYYSLDDSEKKIFQTQAESRVKLSFILDFIRENEPDAVLSEGEARNGLMQQAKMSGKDPETFIVEAERTGRILGMLAGLKDEFALQWLVDQAKLIE